MASKAISISSARWLKLNNTLSTHFGMLAGLAALFVCQLLNVCAYFVGKFTINHFAAIIFGLFRCTLATLTLGVVTFFLVPPQQRQQQSSDASTNEQHKQQQHVELHTIVSSSSNSSIKEASEAQPEGSVVHGDATAILHAQDDDDMPFLATGEEGGEHHHHRTTTSTTTTTNGKNTMTCTSISKRFLSRLLSRFTLRHIYHALFSFPSRKIFLMMLFYSFIGVYGAQMTFIFALKFTTPVNISIISPLNIVTTTSIALLFRKEQPGVVKLLGVTLAVGSAMLMVVLDVVTDPVKRSQFSLFAWNRETLGNVLMFLNVIVGGSGMVFLQTIIEKAGPSMPTPKIAFQGVFLCNVMLALTSLLWFRDWIAFFQSFMAYINGTLADTTASFPPVQAWIGLLYYGCITVGIGMLLSVFGTKKTSSMMAALINCLQSVEGMLLQYIAYGQVVKWFQGVCSVVIIAGMVMVIVSKSKELQAKKRQLQLEQEQEKIKQEQEQMKKQHEKEEQQEQGPATALPKAKMPSNNPTTTTTTTDDTRLDVGVEVVPAEVSKIDTKPRMGSP